MGPWQDAQLVATAIDKARELRGEIRGQVELHADRGTQFTSHQLHEGLRPLAWCICDYR